MIKKIILALLLLILLSVLTAIYCGLYFLSQKTGTSLNYFPRLIYQTYHQPTATPNFNFIVLGLDPRDDKLEKTETTDTIMIARLTPDWKINIVSIPRDLWIYSLNSKINQIYPQSLKTVDHFDYIQNEFGKVTNQKFSKTLIVTTDSLIKLTKIVGGVDLVLDTGFIDKQYPNPDYVASPSSKIPIYKTVEFKSGPVHLDMSNITEFVRSRKSLVGGTDIGRIQRQQLLLDALIAKIKSPQFYKNVDNLSALYSFFHHDLDTNLTDADLISLGLIGYRHLDKISLTKNSIPSGEDPKKDIIYHPQTFINAQWVFVPQDKQYQSFQKFIANSLSSSE